MSLTCIYIMVILWIYFVLPKICLRHCHDYCITGIPHTKPEGSLKWPLCPPNGRASGSPFPSRRKFPGMKWSFPGELGTHMMVGPKWDLRTPKGSFFQRKHTVFSTGGPREDRRRVHDVTRERDEDEVGMSLWVDRQTNMSHEKSMVGSDVFPIEMDMVVELPLQFTVHLVFSDLLVSDKFFLKQQCQKQRLLLPKRPSNQWGCRTNSQGTSLGPPLGGLGMVSVEPMEDRSVWSLRKPRGVRGFHGRKAMNFNGKKRSHEAWLVFFFNYFFFGRSSDSDFVCFFYQNDAKGSVFS